MHHHSAGMDGETAHAPEDLYRAFNATRAEMRSLQHGAAVMLLVPSDVATPVPVWLRTTLGGGGGCLEISRTDEEEPLAAAASSLPWSGGAIKYPLRELASVRRCTDEEAAVVREAGSDPALCIAVVPARAHGESLLVVAGSEEDRDAWLAGLSIHLDGQPALQGRGAEPATQNGGASAAAVIRALRQQSSEQLALLEEVAGENDELVRLLAERDRELSQLRLQCSVARSADAGPPGGPSTAESMAHQSERGVACLESTIALKDAVIADLSQLVVTLLAEGLGEPVPAGRSAAAAALAGDYEHWATGAWAAAAVSSDRRQEPEPEPAPAAPAPCTPEAACLEVDVSPAVHADPGTADDSTMGGWPDPGSAADTALALDAVRPDTRRGGARRRSRPSEGFHGADLSEPDTTERTRGMQMYLEIRGMQEEELGAGRQPDESSSE